MFVMCGGRGGGVCVCVFASFAHAYMQLLMVCAVAFNVVCAVILSTGNVKGETKGDTISINNFDFFLFSAHYAVAW